MAMQIVKFQGVPTYIVGCVMQRGDTVLTGSGGTGPIFYSSEVLENAVESFKGKPVYLMHQEAINGVSTIDPANADKAQIGTIYNPAYNRQSRELTAQLYLNIRLVKSKEKELGRRIENEQPIEVSTGLAVDRFVDREKGYYVATSVNADHIAVLCCSEGLKGGMSLSRMRNQLI